METYNKTNPVTPVERETKAGKGRSGRMIAGLIVVAFGVIFLASELGADIPRWVFSFKTLLIALGLFIGFQTNFKGFVWLIPIIFGGAFLLEDFFPYYDISDFAWPVVIIAIGLYIVFKSSKTNSTRWHRDKSAGHNYSDDFIDATVVFGGVKKNVISKNFRGGDATTIFGGTDINLMQADINGHVVMDITTIFGGTKLLVPPHWKINSEDLVAVFGGVEDKRPQLSDPNLVDPGKVLVLSGTCLFGGIDIKSY